MTATPSDADTETDAYETIGPDAPELNRYASFEADEDLIVYDRENEAAWLQSDGGVELADRR